MQIVIVGHVCIDKNTTENASYVAAGGPAVFMDKVYAQIPEIHTTIVVPYGSDFLPFAHHLPLFPKRPTSDITLIYENTMRNGIRSQKAYNRNKADPIPMEQETRQLLAGADILIIAPLIPNLTTAYIQQLVSNTKKGALKVLLPQGYYRTFLPDDSVVVRDFVEEKEILPLMDMVVVSEMDTDEMLVKAEAWSETYSLISVVTLGENGAIAFSKKQKVYLPTTPVEPEKVMDSVGSGDIFSASLAYAYRKTSSLEKAGIFANAIAKACLFYKADDIQIDEKILRSI